MNASLFDVQPAPATDPYRTDSGTLRAHCMKAIWWFSIEHGLKPLGASAYRTFFFKDAEGVEQQFTIETIVKRYDEFKKKTHGRKVAS